MTRSPLAVALALAGAFAGACAGSAGARAGDALPAGPMPVTGDFGGIGLLQMPSARMAEAGELAVFYSRVSPYGRFGFTLQPFDWLEGTFRYASIYNRRYGPDALSGNQSFKDKAFDLKLRLLQEDALWPQVSVGGRDIAGTGLFSGEYVAASKRFGDLDLSLGMGWGYVGNAGRVDNPLSWIDKRFDVRHDGTQGGQGGEFNARSWFRGRASLFGGVQWQTPVPGLQLMLEYDGNDYRNEPLHNRQEQASPFNVGAIYRLSDWIDVRAGWERGNTAMIGIVIHSNLSRRSAPTKLMDPPAPPLRKTPPPSPASEAGQDWSQVARTLEDNAGYRVSRIARREREIVVEGEQTRYFHASKAIGRAARILDANAAGDVDWLTVVDTRYGMPLTETSIKRDRFRDAAGQDGDAEALEDLRRTVERIAPSPHVDRELHRASASPLTYGASVGYRQNLGGPDNFILYQFNANFDAEYRLSPGTWVAGRISANLLNNFDSFDYTAPSGLPRVRTNLREYWTRSDVILPYLQLGHARRLDQDLYGMMYGGLLESMFAGVGGELLYRPMNERWALGVDVNAVKQRGFEQDFSLRDYRTVTGHVTGYYRGVHDVLAKVSAGRYLAGDYGVTLDLSREFSNGVRFGAWATVTDASKKAFGEGSFDKGIYISIPFDELMTTSTMRRADLAFAPLTRDGGARLDRAFPLFELTEGRNLDLFHQNFSKIIE
ncbi:YjbH domain-containing protein [Azoarcus sp. KH32C]|uniref:YjbH domain-containing protein n=1 Tax=Azoarcus sp. KH32C TaxID=748247 RepID=UPI0002386912|nr:YjbH domain-containing protein [Azoarcus sp. KH32C]BAL23229.1 hypothetical protein AZKH_0893 [Azoarcus sp. KH32C]